MKYTFSNYKSYKKLIVNKTAGAAIEQIVKTGDILVPNGLGRCNIQLPPLANSHGLEVIKMDRTDGGFRISINRGAGQIKGLVMALDSNDDCRIMPIAANTKSLVFTEGLADGSATKLLSDSSDWFLWSLGGRASNTTGPFLYQSPSNGGLGTREAGEETEAESITGLGDEDGSNNSQLPEAGTPQTTPQPAPIGEEVQVIDLLTITSIVDGNSYSYPIAGDNISDSSVTLTFTGTYHNDVQTLTLSGTEDVTLGANNTWTHDVELSSLGRHTLVFRAFAVDGGGSPYGPEEEVAVFTLDVEEVTPHLLAYDLLEITHVNGQEWSTGDVIDEVIIPSNVVISGTYHEDVEGIIANNRSSSGTMRVDTDAKTWTFTETISSTGSLSFTFTAQYEDDLQTESLAIEFAEEAAEESGSGGGGAGGSGGSGGSGSGGSGSGGPRDLFSITSTVDSSNNAVGAGLISSSEAVTISGDVLVSDNVEISINSTPVTITSNTWSYTQTITSTTTFEFTCIDPNDSNNIDTESVTVTMTDPSQVITPPIAQGLPAVGDDPADTLVVTPEGDVEATGDTFVFDNTNGGIFPSIGDLFTIEVVISMTTDMKILDFYNTGAYIKVIGSKVVAGGALFDGDVEDPSVTSNNITTILDLTTDSINLTDGVVRRLVLVFDRRWSVTTSAAGNQGSWRIHGAIGDSNGAFQTGRYFYFPRSSTGAALLNSSLKIGLGTFLLKSLVILQNIDLAPNQISAAIEGDISISEVLTQTSSSRTTSAAYNGDNIAVNLPSSANRSNGGSGPIVDATYGFTNLVGTSKYYLPGMINSLNDSYPQHEHGKTMAISLRLNEGFPEDFTPDIWTCVISKVQSVPNNVDANKGWGLMIKYTSTTSLWSVAWIQQAVSNISTSIDAATPSTGGIVAAKTTSLDLGSEKQLSFIIKSKLSEYRGYNTIEIFLNNVSSPILTFDVQNYLFSTNFGTIMDNYDIGPTWTNADFTNVRLPKLTVGGLRSNAWSTMNVMNTTSAIFPFFKVFYGLTDSATDAQLLSDMQASLTALPAYQIQDWIEEAANVEGLSHLSIDNEGIFVSSDTNTTAETATIENYFAFKEWTSTIVNDCVSFSLWFKWDGGAATPPQTLTLMSSNNGNDFPFSILIYDRYNDDNHSVVTATTSNQVPTFEQYNELSSTLAIDVLDGEWHHIFVSRSKFQTSFLAKGTYDYIVVDGAFESNYVKHNNFVNGGQTIETNANFEGFLLGSDANAFSLDSIEILNGTKLTFEQAKWLHDEGRGVGTIQNASTQATTDLYSAGEYIKHSTLFTSDLIDATPISPDTDGNYSGINIDIKDVNFRWETAQGWPGKAYSFWFKCKDTNNTGTQTILQLFYGGQFWKDAGDLQSDIFGLQIEANTNLTQLKTKVYAAQEGNFVNQWQGMRVGFRGTHLSSTIAQIAGGEMVHCLVTIKKLANNSISVKTFINGTEINDQTYNGNLGFCVNNGRIGVLTTGANFDINGDIEVLLGEFDTAQVATIYSDAQTANPYAANYTVP